MHDFVVLKDRILWRDGSCTVKPERYAEFLAQYQKPTQLFVTELDQDVAKYNSLVPKEKQIQIKDDLDPISLKWKIPSEYMNMTSEDILEYVLVLLASEFKRNDFTEDEQEERGIVVERELRLFEGLGHLDVLKTMIYIVQEFTKNKVVWGVGRGSSVASYVLYLIGVHDVDSVKFGLDYNEFLR